MNSSLRKAKTDAALDLMRGLRQMGFAGSFCEQPLHREISLPQLQLLLFLHEQGRLTVSQLANALQISLPSTSAILDRLEERHLVLRARDTSDRRVVTLDITDKGRGVAEDLAGFKRERISQIIEAMTEGELGAFLSGLQALSSSWARLNGKQSAVRRTA